MEPLFKKEILGIIVGSVVILAAIVIVVSDKPSMIFIFVGVAIILLLHYLKKEK